MGDLVRSQGTVGDTAVDIKRYAGGSLQAVRGVVGLSLKKKEIVEIKKTMSITASGYDRLNQIAGLSLVMPDKINVPRYGSQPNPFFVLNESTQSIQFVMAKASAIGYSPIGSMCVVDQTLLFDLNAYFRMDCMAKLKYKPGFGKITNKMALTEEELRMGLFLPVLDENFGIWVDSRHDEFMKLLSEHQQRQRFAERIALGILRRNCLRHHPAIAASVVTMAPGGVANVTVTGVRHELTEEDMRDMADGKRKEDVEVISGEVHTDGIGAEDMGLSMKEATVGEDKDEVQIDDAVQLSERDLMYIRLEEMKGFLGDDEYEKFYAETVTSKRPVEEFNNEDLERYLNVLKKKIEEIA